MTPNIVKLPRPAAAIPTEGLPITTFIHFASQLPCRCVRFGTALEKLVMKLKFALLPMAALVFTAAPALAGHARPGLWNSTVVLDLGGHDPQMSADQSARMNSMGVQMPGRAQPMISKMCLTPADAAADTPPKRAGCIYQGIKWAGNSATGGYVCKGLMNGSGKFTVTYASDRHYEGSTTFVGDPVQGKSAKAFTKFSGDWVSPDCGNVKPVP